MTKSLSIIVTLLLSACASEPLTEEQQFQKEYEENDRIAQYERWAADCNATDGMTIFADNPFRSCRSASKKCVPHRWDWDWNHELERPELGNAYKCVTRRQIEDSMRSMSR